MAIEPVVLAVFALALCGFGAVSGRAERSPFTAPMLFTAVGVLLSDDGFGLLHLDVGETVLSALAELTLILVLFTDAARIDFTMLRRERGLPERLLAIGMPLTLAAGTLAATLLLPQLGIAQAALLAALLMPTDAALGQAVVNDARIPLRIRQTLNVESGLNDGIALPVVLVLASLAGAIEATHDTVHWLRIALLAVTLGPLCGATVGWVGGRVLGLGVERGYVSAPFQRLSALGLALLAYAGAELVGGNGFIAAFVAGLTVGNSARALCPHLLEFGEAEGQLFSLLVFLLFGAILIPEAWPHWDLRALGYAGLSLTVVRMLPVSLALFGTGLSRGSHLFLGWFGPRGLASILFVLLVVQSSGLAERERISGIVVLTVLLSTALHGMTAHPLAGRYGRYAGRLEPAVAEHREVDWLPVRIGNAPRRDRTAL